jgi:hypothetical protein
MHSAWEPVCDQSKRQTFYGPTDTCSSSRFWYYWFWMERATPPQALVIGAELMETDAPVIMCVRLPLPSRRPRSVTIVGPKYDLEKRATESARHLWYLAPTWHGLHWSIRRFGEACMRPSVQYASTICFASGVFLLRSELRTLQL